MRPTALLVVAGLCVLAVADEPPRKNQQDPQAKAEPRSAPGAGQKLLEQFAGEWHVAKAFYPRTGAPVRSEGHCRQTMIHDGRFLESDFVFEQNGTKSTGKGIIGFETETGLFTSFWTDSRRTRMSLRQSREKFDGQQIVLYSRPLDSQEKEARLTKTVTRLEDGGHKLVHRQYAVGADGTERVMMELIMTRQSSAPKR
jgi:hypothetical protein